MIGLLVATNGDFGAALLRAAEFVVGPMPQTAVVSLTPADDVQAYRDAFRETLKKIDSGQGVIVATDLFGTTPSNIAVSLMDERVEVIAGVNLPLLIRFDTARKDQSLSDCAETLREMGRKYINRARDVLDQGKDGEDPLPVPPPGEAIETADALQQLADNLSGLSRLLRSAPQPTDAYGRIGHNLPPLGFAAEDEEVLEEGQIAARVASAEIATGQARADVLKLCVHALKRVLKLLKEIAQWMLAKGDLFVDAAAKSAGKAVGPAIVVSVTVAQLTGRLSELIGQLRSLAGL